MGVILIILVIAGVIVGGLMYIALTPMLYSMKTDARWDDVQTQYPAFIDTRDSYYQLFFIGGPIGIVTMAIIYSAKYTQRGGDGF